MDKILVVGYCICAFKYTTYTCLTNHIAPPFLKSRGKDLVNRVLRTTMILSSCNYETSKGALLRAVTIKVKHLKFNVPFDVSLIAKAHAT